VIPIKDEKDNLGPLHSRLRAALDPLLSPTAATPLADYELLFIDDGSTDGSHAVLEELARKDARVKVVRLRRNFGQTPALRAGIDFSRGDVLVTMDGDLQNDPADIPRLLEVLNQGHDAVFGRRANRQDDYLVRKLPSRIANWVIRKTTGTNVHDLGCTLRAMRRELAESLPLYGEMHRFIAVLCQMQGAKVAQIDVTHHARTAGKTKYGLSRTFRVVLDLMTVKFLHGYLTRPMHVMGLAGLTCMALGVVALVATVAMKYLCTPPLFMTGNPLLLLSVMLELVGVQLIGMGLLGEVLSRTYFESQGKTAYLVRSTTNLDPPDEQRRAA